MNYVWSEHYRPKTIKECILPSSLDDLFTGIVESKTVPNLLLSGGAGVGKTTVARALCDELGVDYMFINASKDGDIDTLRTKIQQYASTVTMYGTDIKVVILDEADGLTRAAQPALRAFIEEFSDNCRFILTCNFINKIIDPLQSRCTVVNFTAPSTEKPGIAMKFMESIKRILDKECVEYDDKVVVEIIKKCYPDFRSVLIALQAYSIKNKKIDSGMLSKVIDAADIKTLVSYFKAKEFTKMRKWLAIHIADTDPQRMIRELYDGMYKYMKKESIPRGVIILAECQYRLSFVADPEIQLVASFADLMMETEFE